MDTSRESTPAVRRFFHARGLLRAALLILIVLGGVFDTLLVTIHRTGQQDETRPAAAILIPGSGVNYDGSPSENFLARIEHGRRLYEAGYAPLIALTGGSRGEGLREEARVAEEILLADGMPPEAILVEDRSQNTVENVAYIAPALHERGVESILLVTSPFHEWRAGQIAAAYGFTVYHAPVPDDPAEYPPWRRARYMSREVGASLLYLWESGW
jgi:uncharacterized SAM-binding protein YcdF (DUF218 family)